MYNQTIKGNFITLSYKALYSFQSVQLFFMFRIIDPVLHYSFYAILASALVGTSYLQFVVIGNVLFYTCQIILINFINMFRYERRYGTLGLNIASPTSLLVIIMKRSIVPIIDGLFVLIISLVIGNLFFSLEFPYGQLFNLILIILVFLFTVLCFSLLLAFLALLFENVNLFLNLVLGILQVFSGVNFSVNLLPNIFRILANFSPITYSVQAIRTVYQMNDYNIQNLLFKSMILSGIYLVMSLLIYYVLKKIAMYKGAIS